MIEVNKIAIPFAQSGNKSKIYDTRQPEQAENEATWSTGFPPITMIRKEDGGLPPTGLDFNGIFYDISSNVVFACMGGRYKFDPEYAEKIGGYPKGAILLNDDENKQYISNIANNKINFNTADPAKLTAWSVISIADIDKILANKIDNADFSGALKRKRDIDDNEFHGLLSLQADSSIGTGVFLLDEDGKVRGQMVYNNYGLQFAQVQEDGTSQTFTFPRYGNGGEILTNRVIANELGNSTDLVASQSLVNQINTALKQAVPVGFVANYIGETAPNSEWLIMRGQKYSKDQYPELYDLLKTDTLPDGRGVMLRGLDANRGFDPGRTLLSYQEDAIPKIAGYVSGIAAWSESNNAGHPLYTVGSSTVSLQGSQGSSAQPRTLFFDNSRSYNVSHENIMKNIAVNIIIKVK